MGDRAAVVLGGVLLGLFALVNDRVPWETSHSFDVWAGGLLVLATALLLASRRFPATVAVLVLAISAVWYDRYTSRVIDLPMLVAFYVLGTTGDRRRQLGVGGAATALLIFGAVSSPSDVEIAVEGVGWTAAAILCGELVRSRRLLLDHYAERASRAEAERDAEAERRVTQERLRIARDLHDVLAHTVSLMTVQAGVAADAVDRDPDEARTALATLRSAGKEAMAEVRATVSVLRAGGGDDGDGDRVETAPAPTLERVQELVDAARAQGLEVELTVDLEGIELDSLVELTAYRVVQESLTNVIRHADATSAAVRIHPGFAGLVVEVVDDGRARQDTSSGPTAGFGLEGMAERVEVASGQLSYGPRPGRGWAVRATLPIRRRPGRRQLAATGDDRETGRTGKAEEERG